MTDLIQRIAEAIIRQEGMPVDYPNPGNLRAAPWLRNPEIEKGFWRPISREQGEAGLLHEIALHVAEGDSLRQFISRYAPSEDHNNTEAYIHNVAMWANVPDVEIPLWSYLRAE